MLRLIRRLIGTSAYFGYCEAIAKFALLELGIGTTNDFARNGELTLLQRLPATPCVFDVGANCGDFANAVLQIRPNADLHCFEPSEDAFSKLQVGKRNRLALGASKGTFTLYADARGSQLASLYKRRLDHVGLKMEPVEIASVETLDNYCHLNGIRHIDFLKLDVEGHELAVMQGSSKMLSNGAIDTILFEFGGTDIDSRVFFQDFFYFLRQFDMAIHCLAGNYLRPIETYSEFCEQFVYTNYVAIRR